MAMWHFGQKPFRMIWKVERGGRRNYLAGTAHFFPWSFRKSLRTYIHLASDVLFEGPLEETDMEKVRQSGYSNAPPALYEKLDGHTIAAINKELERHTTAGENDLASYISMMAREKGDALSHEIAGLAPWMAFFKLWSSFLKRRGWHHSVDLEALAVAKQLGKKVHYLETIDEQVAAMNGIPLDRIVHFLQQFGHWEKFAHEHEQCYL